MNDPKEYIERGALIDSFENWYWLYNSTDREIVIQALVNAPAADAAPVVHGEWVKTQKGMQCTRCNCLSSLFDENLKSSFCPWCGAKMDGGKHER